MPVLKINGRNVPVDAPEDMPLLWALRDVVGMTGTKFGCGIAMCGACTVLIDGNPARSCVTPLAAIAGKGITTIEGAAKLRKVRRFRKRGSLAKSPSAATANLGKSCPRAHFESESEAKAIPISTK